MNENATQLIKDFEGLRLKKYKCAAGVDTIGYGHTGNGLPDTSTKEQAERWLEEDMVHASDFIFHSLPNITLASHQLGAVVSLVFNIGVGNFEKSTMRTRLLNMDASRAADEFPKWRKAGGKVLAGLEERRAAERHLFLTGEYVGREGGDYKPGGRFWKGVDD